MVTKRVEQLTALIDLQIVRAFALLGKGISFWKIAYIVRAFALLGKGISFWKIAYKV